MTPPLALRFVLSAKDPRDLPDSPAEVALIGRSNVGKSSLVNALSGHRDLARVSKTPGRTRLLNCFELKGGGTLVDCPGYGYAEASKKDRAAWGAMTERYLTEREPLAMVMVLVDGEIGPTRLDVDVLDWLRAKLISHTVVATKHDKLKATHRPRRRQEVAAGCRLVASDVVWVSAAKGVGIDDLRALVHLWTAAPASGRGTGGPGR